MTESIERNNFYGCISGNIFPAKESGAFTKMPKVIQHELFGEKYGHIAANFLSAVLEYNRDKRHANDSKVWPITRALSYFRSWNLTKYKMEMVYNLLKKHGFLNIKKNYPSKDKEDFHNRISYSYTFYENPKDNPLYNCKKEARKRRQQEKQKYVQKIATTDLLNNIKDDITETPSIKHKENKINNIKNNKDEEVNFEYTKKVEYLQTEESGVNIAKTLYENSIYNPLLKNNHFYKINNDSDIIEDYEGVINDSINDLLDISDNKELAKEGCKIILKGIMDYKKLDINNNLEHANNLVNKFSEYDSFNLCVDSLWKFREYNKIFKKDLNRNINDNLDINIKNVPIIYPNSIADESDGINLYILENYSVDESYNQRIIKNSYFINFCYMIGSYLYCCKNNLVKEENKPYSNGMLSYQDINAFTQIFQNYPELIYLPIDEVNMNLLGRLYNEHQANFRK